MKRWYEAFILTEPHKDAESYAQGANGKLLKNGSDRVKPSNRVGYQGALLFCDLVNRRHIGPIRIFCRRCNKPLNHL